MGRWKAESGCDAFEHERSTTDFWIEKVIVAFVQNRNGIGKQEQGAEEWGDFRQDIGSAMPEGKAEKAQIDEGTEHGVVWGFGRIEQETNEVCKCQGEEEPVGRGNTHEGQGKKTDA